MEYHEIEKKKLYDTSERYKLELENELKEVSVKTDKLLTNALIIGGSLALTYFVVSQLMGSPKKSKKTRPKGDLADDTETEEDEPTLLSQLGSKLVDQATLILLDIAKEKLSEYLQSKRREDS